MMEVTTLKVISSDPIEDEICSAATERLANAWSSSGFAAFLFGFIAGQCEKLVLGACAAAMFSKWPCMPDQYTDDWFTNQIARIAYDFNLATTKVEDEELGLFEVWVFRPGTNALKWTQCVPNSSQWHLLRGLACGVKPENIDIDYHELVRKASRCSTTEGEG